MTIQEQLNARLAATNIIGFATLVGCMRSSQREYFKTRSRDVLIRSKSLESQVDAAVHEVLKP